MSATNSYRDSDTGDILNDVRIYIAEQKAGRASAGDDVTLTFISPLDNQINFSNSVATTLKTLGDYKVVDNTGKLVAFLPMELTVNDTMNSNHGTVTGTETYADSDVVSPSHPMRKAFSFDGSSYITLDNESNFDFEHTDTFSVSFRFMLGSLATDQGLIVKSADLGTGVGWGVYYDNASGFIVFKISDGTTEYSVASTTSILALRWYTCMATFAGSSNQSGMKIYVDGVLEATGASSAISSTVLNSSAVVIGAESDGGSIITNGSLIDDLQIWNTENDADDADDIHQGKQISQDTSVTKPAFFDFSDVA